MSQTENIAASAAKLSSSWRDEVNQIRTRLNSLRARSCWDRGVNGFALDLAGIGESMVSRSIFLTLTRKFASTAKMRANRFRNFAKKPC